MSELIREIGKIKDSDLQVEGYRNFIFWTGHFTYESGTGQGCGIILGGDYLTEFLHNIMNVFYPKSTDFRLPMLNDKLCYVTHDWSNIYKLEPIFLDDKLQEFDIETWRKRKRPSEWFDVKEFLPPHSGKIKVVGYYINERVEQLTIKEAFYNKSKNLFLLDDFSDETNPFITYFWSYRT